MTTSSIILAPDRTFPTLNAARAAGAGAVLLTHVAFNTGEVMRGWTGALMSRLDFGVCLFFILSGFLLSRPYFLAAHGIGRRPDLKHYWWKRGLRILPLYWIVVVLAHLADPANRGLPASTWLTDLTLTQIYVDRGPTSSLTQMWSLATEAAFYVALPLLASLCIGPRPRADGSLRRSLLVLAALSGLGVAWTVMAAVLDTDLPLHQWLPGFLPWFAVGMGFAAVSASLRATPRPHVLDRLGRDLAGCWLLGATVFAIAATELAGPRSLVSPTPWEAAAKCVLYTVAGAFLILPLVFGPERDGRVRTWLASPVPHWLGEVSYGIFCIHMMVLVVGMERMGIGVFTGRFTLVLLMTVVVTLFLSALAHRFVEEPMLALKNRGPFVPERSTAAKAETSSASRGDDS